MYWVPPARAWWPAVGAPLERGVRPRWRQPMLLALIKLDRRRCLDGHSVRGIGNEYEDAASATGLRLLADRGVLPRCCSGKA